MSGKTLESGVCVECGKDYRRVRSHSVYCGRACRQRSYRRRKTWEMVEFTVSCDWCMVRYPLPHMSLWIGNQYNGVHWLVLCDRCSGFAHDRGLVRAIVNDKGEVVNEISKFYEEG